MTNNGTVASYQTLFSNGKNLGPTLPTYSFFGSALANLGDIYGDGFIVLAVGAKGYTDTITQTPTGMVLLYSLDHNGTVRWYKTYSKDSAPYSLSTLQV